jgi:tetratricopeptide (TPR) repeat protein
MFSRMTLVRLKAAENALRDGRFDEAYRLATEPDLRDHRRAQKLLTKVAKKLVARARAHYDAGLYDEAIRDLDRAATANVGLDEINRLRAEIREAARQSRHRREQQQRRLEAARDRIEAGSLVGGRRLLDQADAADPRAERLLRQAAANAAQAKSEIERAEKLLKQDRIPAAVEHLRRAQGLSAHDPGVVEFEGKLTGRVFDAAQEALLKGRTDRARAELDMLGRLGRNDPRRQELERNLDLIERVAHTAAAAQYDEALRLLRQLQHLLPQVRWIKDAAGQVQKLYDARMALLSGPLGISAPSGRGTSSPSQTVPAAARRPRAIDQPTRLVGADPAPAGLPPRLLMLVDGVGSFLILTQPRVSIGRISAGPGAGGAVADIALMADISKHHADIARIEDDYFIFPHREVRIDGRPGGPGLLFDRNRVTVGKLVRMTFRLPNPRSNTAVLTLSGGARMHHGVRQVLLFDELAVLGPNSNCHVRLPRVANNVILYVQNGKLYMRPQPRRPEERFDPQHKHEIRLGEPFTIENIGFCFEPWPDEAGQKSAIT